MKPFLKPFVNWFGYTGRERRASIILLVIMVIVILLRFAVPQSRMKIKDLSARLIPYKESEKHLDPANASRSLSSMVFSGKRFQDKRSQSYQAKKIELNLCDSADLERLPGIGPVLSARIIKFRNLLGGYASVKQLKEVYGLRDSTYNLIAGRVTADSSLIKKIEINTAGFSELNRHPYLDRYDVQAILKYREIEGRIDGISCLIEHKILTGEKASKILPYFCFD